MNGGETVDCNVITPHKMPSATGLILFIIGTVGTITGLALIFSSIIYFGTEAARGRPIPKGEVIGKLLMVDNGIGFALVVLHNIWVAISTSEQ